MWHENIRNMVLGVYEKEQWSVLTVYTPPRSFYTTEVQQDCKSNVRMKNPKAL